MGGRPRAALRAEAPTVEGASMTEEDAPCQQPPITAHRASIFGFATTLPKQLPDAYA